MKKALLATALLAVIGAAHAQENTNTASFGVKAGLNLTNLSFKFEDETERMDMKAGVHAGIFARFSLVQGLAFQPELLFSSEGAKESEDEEKVTFKLNYVQVPLMLQYELASGFYAEVGPGFGYLLSGKAKYEFEGETEEEDLKEDLQKLSVTGNIGLGYALSSGIGVNLRYVKSLSNLWKDSDDEKMRGSNIQLSIFKRF